MTEVDQSRRSALRLLGMGGVAMTFMDSPLKALLPEKRRIGIQLYTVRHIIERDFERTLRTISDIGYWGIEYYPLPESISADRANRVFKECRLEVLGMHVPLPVGKERDGVVKLADIFKCDRIVYPGGSQIENFKDLETAKRTVERYDEIASFLKSKGLQFGLHNHSVEFEETAGIVPNYYLLEHLAKSVFFEIDTYWTKVAGKDPARVVHDFGKRAPLLHIKDGPAIEGPSVDKQLPAGDGNMNFPAIVNAGGSNIDWMIVEFDEYENNILDGIRKSYGYLTRNKLAYGRV